MSEIYYRVWDKDEKEFVDAYSVLVDGKGNAYGFNGFGDNVEIKKDRYEMDVKTSLLDGNLDEIFINDFVIDTAGDYWLVEMINGVAVEPFTTWVTNEEVTVVGNTRENPNILEYLEWR